VLGLVNTVTINKYFKQIDYIKEVKKWRLNSILFILTAIPIPFLAYIGLFMPSNEDIQIWFQRSGSLIVLISSLAEYHAFKMLNTFNPIEMANEPEFTTKIQYSNQAKILIIVSAICIGIGTIIWGYGDILYRNL